VARNAQRLACLRPYPSELLETYPVSALVNSVRNDSEALIEPAA
jgi:putative SOS response-associated peptidase YedK